MNFYVLILAVILPCINGLQLPDSKISGGELAERGQFPYMAAMARNGKYTCGGAVITDRWILTAAHCVKDHPTSEMTIHVGTNKFSDGGTKYHVDKAIKHDKVWDAVNLSNDIAVLHTTESIEFSDLVQPIALSKQLITQNTEVVLSGWGHTKEGEHSVDDLQWIKLKTISQKDCQARHAHKVRHYMMCTFTTVGEGSCKGDSGSPLVLDGKVVGITSWGKHCGGGYPSVYTRVSSFYTWVNETINQNSYL